MALAITSPADGAKMTGTSVGVTWTTGTGSAWYLSAGSTLDGTDYYDETVSGGSATITGLPTDGTTVYIHLEEERTLPNGHDRITVTAVKHLSASLSDALALTPAREPLTELSASTSSSLIISDGHVGGFAIAASLADALGLVDAATSLRALIGESSDELVLTETVSVTAVLAPALVDAIDLGTNPLAGAQRLATLSDMLVVTSTEEGKLVFGRVLEDIIALSASEVVHHVMGAVRQDLLTLSGVDSSVISLIVSGQLALTMRLRQAGMTVTAKEGTININVRSSNVELTCEDA